MLQFFIHLVEVKHFILLSSIVLKLNYLSWLLELWDSMIISKVSNIEEKKYFIIQLVTLLAGIEEQEESSQFIKILNSLTTWNRLRSRVLDAKDNPKKKRVLKNRLSRMRTRPSSSKFLEMVKTGQHILRHENDTRSTWKNAVALGHVD